MNLSIKDVRFPALIATAFLFSSCGSMETIKTSATDGVSKVGQGIGKVGTGIGSGIGNGFGKVAKLTTSPFRPGVPVVEAREDAMKELPSGQEQAIAYQQKHRGFWGFFGPVDFKEPTLPDESGSIDGGLLPPIE